MNAHDKAQHDTAIALATIRAALAQLGKAGR